MQRPNVLIALAIALVSTAGWADSKSDTTCLECHEGARASEKRLSVDIDRYERSVHADTTCVGCHSDAEGDACKNGLAKVDCASCHEEEQARFDSGVHSQAKDETGAPAVTCADCHGTHDTLFKGDPQSTVYPTEQPRTCAKCHDGPDVKKRNASKVGFRLSDYEKSAHWLGTAEDGLVVTATCVSCHGNHDMRAVDDPKSSVSRTNLPKTCGECHEGMADEYLAGAHGQALMRGSADTPICTDCHGDHGILDHEDPRSSVYATRVSKTTCPQCHSGEYINRRYGLGEEQVQSYADSFHGLADRFGDPTVANCASCHGAHKVLPSDDPQSSVHASNLPETCGACHEGAGQNFAKGRAHEPSEAGAEGSAALTWVRFVYIIIIGVSLTGMFLHNALDYFAAMRERYRANRAKRRYVRFDAGERVQHMILVLSFMLLVFTGFALKYPEAFWVKPLINSKLSFLARGYVHRVSAVVFVVASLYHVYYLITTARGRAQFKAMLPEKKDARDVWHQLRYYVGLEKKPGHFGRYSYVEKFEYLALIWGTIVMIATGLILWFEEGALLWLPKWGWDVADMIHLYEAWLATLSIVIWHFYHVAFKPSNHGVSMAMFTGELTEEEMHHEHPAELETLPATSALEPNEGETSKEEHDGKRSSLQPV